jgi:hypothetical protein
MTASYPNDIYEERETENLPGLVYDPTKKQNLYSEDFQRHAQEIIAIENALGINLSNISVSVVSRILDGGLVSSLYLVWYNLDGGIASSLFNFLDLVDGGAL